MANGNSNENADSSVIPGAEELESLYLLLENSIPELQWKCPGRILEEDKVEKPVEKKSTKPEKTDFDFSDDVAQPQLRTVTHRATPKSAKKKTANFADVVKRIKNPLNP